MHCTLANSKPLCCLTHRRIMVYNVISDCHCPLFDIILHGFTLKNVFYILCGHDFHYESKTFFLSLNYSNRFKLCHNLHQIFLGFHNFPNIFIGKPAFLCHIRLFVLSQHNALIF